MELNVYFHKNIYIYFHWKGIIITIVITLKIYCRYGGFGNINICWYLKLVDSFPKRVVLFLLRDVSFLLCSKQGGSFSSSALMGGWEKKRTVALDPRQHDEYKRRAFAHRCQSTTTTTTTSSHML